VEPAGGRLVAAAAFVLPPLALLVVALGFALRGGGVAPEQWQPAAVGLIASLLVLSAVGAIPSIPRAAWPMLVCFGALLAWSAASLLWSESREATAENVVRLLMLAGAAVVGAAYAARPRAALALAAGLALFGALAAVLIEVKLLRGSTSAFAGSRLSWPINYANADAALVWLPLPALLTFAAAQPLRPLARGLLGLFAALALAVGLAAESRGAAVALAGAFIAVVAIARDRGRLVLTLLAVVLPAAAVAGRMIGGDPSTSAGTSQARGVAALSAAIVAGALVCGLAMLDRRDRPPFGGREGRIALVLVTALLAVGVALFVAKAGRPDTWLSARWDEFSNLHPTLTTDVSHFGIGFSNRHDYWRVAWKAFESHPVAGIGSGAFAVPWYRHRSLDESVNDAHSWPAGALAETGIVGLGLLAAVLLLPLAAVRNARRGEGVWPIAAVALGGCGVFFVLHASFDWLFRIPAIAVPGFLVLGVLAAGGGRVPLKLVGPVQRTALALSALLAAVAVVPVYLSTREMNEAQDQAVSSTQNAVHKLNEAARLNPFAAAPLVVRAAVLQAEGRRAAAVDAAKEAVARNPEDWTTWAALARAEEAVHDREAARNALRRVKVLNPRASLAGTH
jgi:O-antigen ligase